MQSLMKLTAGFLPRYKFVKQRRAFRTIVKCALRKKILDK